MRTTRLTYEGALHHVLNRGIIGNEIFYGNGNKMAFLELLKDYSIRYKIPVYGYCIMDNDCQIVIQNSSGKMSEFLKQLNATYGMGYRQRSGNLGPVFRDRYRSVLIQDDEHLRTALAFVLQTPVRESIVEHAEEYIWSSVAEYFIKGKSDLVENGYVLKLFANKKTKFRNFLRNTKMEKLPVIRTELGHILGTREFANATVAAQNEKKQNMALLQQEEKTKPFETVENVIGEFEKSKNLRVTDIDIHTLRGKRLRSELLVYLKDRAMVTYGRVLELPLFSNLSLGSLGRLYKIAKDRLEEVAE